MNEMVIGLNTFTEHGDLHAVYEFRLVLHGDTAVYYRRLDKPDEFDWCEWAARSGWPYLTLHELVCEFGLWASDLERCRLHGEVPV